MSIDLLGDGLALAAWIAARTHPYAEGCRTTWDCGYPQEAPCHDTPARLLERAGTPCPTCTGPVRETKGLVCQTCCTDYGATAPREAGWPPAVGCTMVDAPYVVADHAGQHLHLPALDPTLGVAMRGVIDALCAAGWQPPTTAD